MSDHIHDCIVVGAGPAGSAAALQLARDGLDVVLIERGDRPGEKNVMSGVLVADKLAELVPDFVERAPLQRRLTAGYVQHFITDDGVFRMPNLREFRQDPDSVPYFTVFRGQFDAWFAQQAVDAGAELFTATLVEDLLFENGRVAGIRSRRGDLRARVVIGADGVNSTVAEKSDLRPLLQPTEVSLIVREILDLPPETIEDRFLLGPGEGMLSLYTGLVTGPTGRSGIYYTEMYTNLDSLSLTAEVPLDVMEVCGVTAYDVLAQRERHPYIARLIQGAKLREYQAHLIPRGGVGDFKRLYGDGVLLAGDAGKFVTAEGAGSYTSMTSGAAAARTVKHALEKGDFSRRTLGLYLDLLDEEGLLETQRQSTESWEHRARNRAALDLYPEHIVRIGRRNYARWSPDIGQYPTSVLDDAYHSLVKPVTPWYGRMFLGLAAWLDGLRYRREQAHKARRSARA